MAASYNIEFRVNGKLVQQQVEARTLLIDVLRDGLALTGTKEGCGVGVCGACTILIDGELASSCLVLAVRCDGASVTTVEGLAAADGALHPIQQAFVDHGGFQCGICTPGMVLTTQALLAEHPDPSDDDIRAYMMGSLCRCTGYYGIATSVRAAAAALGELAQEAK